MGVRCLHLMVYLDFELGVCIAGSVPGILFGNRILDDLGLVLMFAGNVVRFLHVSWTFDAFGFVVNRAEVDL